MLIPRTSSAFAIGHDHAVCQDYAVDYTGVDHRAIAAILDGCSSSPNTDVGARLLGHELVDRFQHEDHPLRGLGRTSQDVCRVLGLPLRCLDATTYVLTSCRDPDSRLCLGVAALLIGDGALAIRWSDGSSLTTVFEIESGAPDYLSYSLDASRNDAYIEEFGKPVYTNTTTRVSCGVTEVSVQRVERVGASSGHWSKSYLQAGGLVLVFSDGVTAVTRLETNEQGTSRTRVPVPAADVVQEFLRVKVRAGHKWMQARMNGFIRDCAEKGWTFHDDISVAAIFIEDIEEPTDAAE